MTHIRCVIYIIRYVSRRNCGSTMSEAFLLSAPASLRHADRGPSDTGTVTRSPRGATSENPRRHLAHTIPRRGPESLQPVPQQCPVGWSRSTLLDPAQE